MEELYLKLLLLNILILQKLNFIKKEIICTTLITARNSQIKTDEVFIVEGYMDVINLHKFGIKNVVANFGNSND